MSISFTASRRKKLQLWRLKNEKKENQNSQIVIYKDQNGNIKIDVRFDGEKFGTTQLAYCIKPKWTSALQELHLVTRERLHFAKASSS